MHLDISGYFERIDHGVLNRQLNRRFRGPGMRLLNAVVQCYSSSPGKGLPIGALTSQYFANHYLNDIDRWLVSRPEIRAHCRYMDDFLVWSDSKSELVKIVDQLNTKLQDEVQLTLKSPVIAKVNQGVLFCGVNIRPFRLTPSARKISRYRLSRRRWETLWQQGVIDSKTLQSRYDSAKAILLPGETAPVITKDIRLSGYVDA